MVLARSRGVFPDARYRMRAAGDRSVIDRHFDRVRMAMTSAFQNACCRTAVSRRLR
jgi:hypothetical protein